jgi:hypothetical protein
MGIKGSKADLPVCLYGFLFFPPFHHFNAMLVGVIAQLSLPEGSPKEGLLGVGGGTPTMHMEVDWDLGVSGHSDDLPEEEEVFTLCHTANKFLLSQTYQAVHDAVMVSCLPICTNL